MTYPFGYKVLNGAVVPRYLESLSTGIHFAEMSGRCTIVQKTR